MGDTQSAQREGKKDAAAAAAAAEEESGKVEDAQTQNTEDKPLKNNGQISEINGKADRSITEVNGHWENEIAAEAIFSPDEDVSETEKPLKEETLLGNAAIDEKESPNEAEANEDLENTEMDVKQNDINDGFKRFFSNIGLKLTVKRGSREIVTNVPEETNKEEPNRPKDVEDAAKETKSESAEQNTDMNTAQETYDNDSTTCPTLTDITSEDVLENAEKKTAEAKEGVESDDVEEAKTPPVGEDAHEDAKPEEEPHSTSPSSPENEVVVSPIKRFFTTGIFSGLRKKKKPAENETTEKELADMEKKEVIETQGQTAQDQQQDKEKISPGVEAAAVEAEHPSNIIVTETEIVSSQEKEKVQASPIKRLLSGSNLKKISRKQRSRRSSDAKLSDSGEHVSDQLLSSTESAENQKEESPAQPTVEAAEEEDGAWASFKKLVTPKKRVKRPSASNEETQIPGSLEEPKPSEGEQISDRSTEEGKKRKDSSVSWEAVLCGSGRRRSRKTSDSEDEAPENEQRGETKHAAESPPESSNENDILASSPKQAGSPSEGDGGSTWNSLKKLVTPKRKAKDEDENKDNVQSDGEVSQDASSFSIKKLLPGRKKRKSAERQDQVSSDEADKDVASGDEDSETPAVVPLSEFDTVETQVHIQTQVDIETHIPEEANYELQQDLLDQMAEQVLPCDSPQTEPEKVQNNDEALEQQAPISPATNEELDDLTESISKHQQLSDIPEEGIITETMATPASFAEEAARDDTIAEDLIEITSEAFTAPEPPSDITPADETEMISAVSQLSSESSKTSGNTTPVPAEFDVLETDTLLHQVVETISISPETVPVCSEELRSEKTVGSVSHQILEKFVEDQPTILETHRSLDSTAINTGLTAGELDATNELAATPQTESISDVNDSVSTEVVSEVPTEDFNTAEIAEDELQEVNATHPEESVKELERTDESHHLEECLSDINASVSTHIFREETVPDVGSLVDAHQAETELPKTDSQEADSAATVADETKEGAMEQEVPNVTEKEDQFMCNITDQIKYEDKDQPPDNVEELQELAAVQAATLDSEEGRVQLLEKEAISEDMPAAEEKVPLTDVDVEPGKEDELETDAGKTEHVQVPEALVDVQSTLDSEASSVKSREEESEDILQAEAVTDEPKQTAEHLAELSAEPENKELLANAVRTEGVQEPEAVEAVQADKGSDQSCEKEVILEAPEAVTDEPKEETIPLSEVNVEPVEPAKTENVQEQEVLQAVQAATSDSEADGPLSLEREVTSEDIAGVEKVTDEAKQETEAMVEAEEELPVQAAKSEHVQEPVVLPSDVKDSVTETKTEVEALTHVHVVTESIEGGSAQEIEKQILLEDIPKPDTNNVIASVTDEIESEAVARLGQALEITENQKTESIPQDVQVEQEHCVPEVVDELQTVTAVHVSSITEEASSVHIIEKAIFSEETSEPCVDNAAVTDEPKHEVHLSTVKVSIKQEKESGLPGTETKTAPVQHAVLAQVVVCNLKEVAAAIPDVLIEKTSEINEPLIDTVASQLVFKEEVEAAPPLMKDAIAETAEEGSEVVVMHVPSVTFEDNHRIQAQVVDVDIKSAETIVDSVLEVGVTEAKEVIDVCHETVKEVDNLFATPEIEQELIHEENKVTIQEVTQHVKENLPDTVPEPNLEQEVIKEQDAVTKVSEMVESKSNEVEDQKAMEDSVETFKERQEEAPAVISDDSATEQQVSKDLMQTPDIPESLDVSIHDHKEDLEKTKAERQQFEGSTAEEVKSSSKDLDVKEVPEQAEITQIAQSPIVTPIWASKGTSFHTTYNTRETDRLVGGWSTGKSPCNTNNSSTKS
ncbi:uncharacterized protein akap12a [Symphorus nematophorus]